MPLDLKDVTEDDFEARCRHRRPTKDALVLHWVHICHVCVVDSFELNGDVLERFKDLDSPTTLELVHHSSRKDPLSCAMSEVDEGATWVVEGVVPAVRVLILIRLLDPLEDLEERLEFDLAIC